jgi:glycosyltransferase involved in cell wall biosynthesis
MAPTPPPRISILLPFHREGGMLEEAIRSILQQSLEDWELVLVDSEADAATRTVAAGFARSDERIRHVTADTPGIGAALNLGLTACSAPHIARMDADDRMMPERLRLQTEFLDRHPDIGLVACRCEVFPATQENEGYRLFVDWQNTLLSPDDHRRNRFVESPVAHPAVLFRKDLTERFGGYRTDGVPEDYELWLRWMDRDVRFVKLPETLLQWRDRPERLSRNHPDYTEEAFFRVKADYLHRFLTRTLRAERPLVVCGGSRNIRNRTAVLEAAGLRITAYTDVVRRQGNPLPYLPVADLPAPGTAFFISLIGQRGVREEIRKLLTGSGHREEQDFLLLA